MQVSTMGLVNSTQSQLALAGILIHCYATARKKSNFPTIFEYIARVFRGRSVLQVFLGDLIGICLVFTALRWLRYARRLNRRQLKNAIGAFAFSFLKVFPPTAKKLQDEAGKVEKQLDKSLKAHPKLPILHELPEEGMEDGELLDTLSEIARTEDGKWKKGQVSGAVYHGQADHLDVLNKIYSMFSVTNPLHADVWPSICKMEAEICQMTAAFMNGGDENVCGCMSSGGTESIVLAAKAYRSWARSRGINHPEVIAAVSAHAAIDKACDLLDIKLIKVPVDPETYQIDLRAVRREINKDTILIYSSAPSFPQGVIDPIAELSEIAWAHKLGLHVDCCLGGFVLPFARMLGRDIPDFDFGLRGVTSMSVDTHKYGYASKGTSVILYRNKDLRRHQFFTFPEWTGGLYVTPTIAGSRPGALIASCWGSMVRLGLKGYKEAADQILTAAARIRIAIENEIDGLKVLGDPRASVVCFGSDVFNVYHVGDKLSERGWSLNILQHPPCIHIAVTLAHLPYIDEFINALRTATEEVRTDPNIKDKEGGSAIYGMAATLPAGPVSELLTTYVDVTLKVGKPPEYG